MNTIIKSFLRILHRYELFLATIAILGLVFVFVVFLCIDHIPIPVGCPFKAISGIPCPGCGGVRTTQFLLKGDFINAIYTNPLSCLFCLFCATLPLWSFYDCYRSKQTLKTFLTTKWPNNVLIIVGVILLANWIWNIIKHL